MDNITKNLKILFDLKQQKQELNQQLKELNKRIFETEIDVKDDMQKRGLLKITTNEGTVYMSEQTVPHVVNWDDFYEYIQKHGAFHLLERRPSRLAYNELIELGEELPGVVPEVLHKVNTRRG